MLLLCGCSTYFLVSAYQKASCSTTYFSFSSLREVSGQSSRDIETVGTNLNPPQRMWVHYRSSSSRPSQVSHFLLLLET